jgi:hypothetical protein
VRWDRHTLWQALVAAWLVRLGNVCGCEVWAYFYYYFGDDLLCGLTGTVFGPGLGASGFFLGVGDGVDLL